MNELFRNPEEVAVDRKYLATNFADVVPDCCNDAGADMRTELINRYELFNWLINTSLARRVGNLINDRDGACILHKQNGEYVIEIPATYYTLNPESSAEECCWTPFDFDKCEGVVPVHRLCLKDCDDIDDDMLGQIIRMKRDYSPVANGGETVNAMKRRVSRLSMAFLTNANVIQGMDNLTTATLKPFHGLMQVMANPAVSSVQWHGSAVSTFDSAFCRLSMLGDMGDYVIAVHPLLYNTFLSDVRKDQVGSYPEGWRREGNNLYFNNIRFIRDIRVPINMNTKMGEAWLLDGASVGAWLATDLVPTDYFVRRSGHQELPLEDGCGRECTYYYNYGAVFNNNASRLLRIVNIPISTACASAISGLDDLIMGTTMIPFA